MGSAALRDAITGIIDWGETVGRVGGDLPRATEAFGSLTFNDEVQKTRLAKPIYTALRKTISQGAALEAAVADAVASALKDWAVEHGATHYTHWF
jgi:glutamine synthetase